MFRRIKDKLYYYFVQKNWGVCREYEPYVNAHREEHAKARWKHWWMLIRLNWHYRIMRKSAWLCLKNKDVSKDSVRKLPYSNGPESSFNKRISPEKLVIGKLNYDVISFDIFDTLLLRPFARPTDLFFIVGKRLGIPEFHQIRIEVEKKLRQSMYQQYGTWEITIEQIYELIEEQTGLPKELGIKTEFETELYYCRPNPYMKRVYQLFREQGKTMVICSDMYLRQEMISQMLDKIGISDYDKLYLSCEYGCSKNTRGLYKYLINDYKGKKILHIGDNPRADIVRAKDCGLDTLYYENVHTRGNRFRADVMTELVWSGYSGLINIHLHNGIRQYDPYYEYGFIYGGLYIFGFCSWIDKQAKEMNIDKILFLSRDGDIYKRVYDKFFNNIKSEYVLWSRVTSTKYTLVHKKLLALKTTITSMARDSEGISVQDFLSSYDLEILLPYLEQHGLRSDMIIVDEIVNKIEKLFNTHWDLVEQGISKQMYFLEQDIRKKIGNAKRVAIIDIGWLGSGPVALKYIIEKQIKLDCTVECWLAGASSTTKANITADLMDGTLKAYMFWLGDNRNQHDIHIKSNLTSKNRLNNIFIEMLTQARHPSFGGYSNDGYLRFNLPEVENYEYIKSIHHGIMEFCQQYYETFQEDSFMFAIPGADAYSSFRIATRSKSLYRNNFSNFAFPQAIGAKNFREKVETVGNLIDIR